jgi:hypothetical protein
LVCQPNLALVVISDLLGSSHLNFWTVLGSETGTMPPKHETNLMGLFLGEWLSGFLSVATVFLAFRPNLAGCCHMIEHSLTHPSCFQRSNFFCFEEQSDGFHIFSHEGRRAYSYYKMATQYQRIPSRYGLVDDCF